jgi:hypothetical protein
VTYRQAVNGLVNQHFKKTQPTFVFGQLACSTHYFVRPPAGLGMFAKLTSSGGDEKGWEKPMMHVRQHCSRLGLRPRPWAWQKAAFDVHPLLNTIGASSSSMSSSHTGGFRAPAAAVVGLDAAGASLVGTGAGGAADGLALTGWLPAKAWSRLLDGFCGAGTTRVTTLPCVNG